MEIYEREDIKGYYRMKVYGEALMSALSGGGTVNYTSRDVWTTVDASDPAKVYTALMGAAALGIAMALMVGALDAVASRNRPKEVLVS